MSPLSGKSHGIKRMFHVSLSGQPIGLLTPQGLKTRSFVTSWIESPLEIQLIQTDKVGTE